MVEGAFLRPGEKCPPLVAAQDDGCADRICRAAEYNGIACHRHLDTCTTVTPASMPHQFVIRAIRHMTPPVLIDVRPARFERNIWFRPLSNLKIAYASSVASVLYCDSREGHWQQPALTAVK